MSRFIEAYIREDVDPLTKCRSFCILARRDDGHLMFADEFTEAIAVNRMLVQQNNRPPNDLSLGSLPESIRENDKWRKIEL